MIALFRASRWDADQPLPSAMLLDFCHACHQPVARLAGLLTAGPCQVLCDECYDLRTVVLTRALAAHRAYEAAAGSHRLPRAVRVMLPALIYLAAFGVIIALVLLSS